MLMLIAVVAMTFTGCMVTRNSNVKGSDNSDKSRVVNSETGRGTSKVITTEDNAGNSITMIEVRNGNKLVAYNVVIISKTTNEPIYKGDGVVASLDNEARLKRGQYNDITYYSGSSISLLDIITGNGVYRGYNAPWPRRRG